MRGQYVGVGAVLVAFDGEPEALVGRRLEHQLGEQAAAVAVLRVGSGTRAALAADLAPVLRRLALAMIDHRHARPAPAAERGGGAGIQAVPAAFRSEEHTSELQSLIRTSYAVFLLQKKKRTT